MSSAIKNLLRLNLQVWGTLALILGFLLGFIFVLGLGGFPSAPELGIFGLVVLTMAAMFSLLIFIPFFLTSLSFQFTLIYLRRGQQENNLLHWLIGFLSALIFLTMAISAMVFNLLSFLMLSVSVLWSIKSVKAYFREAESFSPEPEKAKRGFDEYPQKVKSSGNWKPSRLLIYASISLFFACGAFFYFVPRSVENNSLDYYAQGIAAFDAGNYGLALENFNHAIELDPNYASYIRRGRTHYALGNNEAALADWAQAEALGFGLPSDIAEIQNELSGNGD